MWYILGATEELVAITPPKPETVARLDLTARLCDLQRVLGARLRRRETLLELIRAANASLDPTSIAEALVTRFASWIPVASTAVVVVDLAGESACLAERNLPPGAEQAIAKLAEWTVRSGTEFWSADLGADARIGNGPSAATVAFPLTARGRTLGTLILIDDLPSSEPPHLGRGVMQSIRLLLESAAIALDNALVLRRTEALSVTDDLTGLYNMRYLNQVLRRETKRALRSGRPLSLLFVDLDGFKSVNDMHGHLAGSRALVETATILRASTRETDVVARYGGDEFAVVLPETGVEGAIAVARRLREKIAQFRFLAAESLDLRLTASVGVATFPDVAASPDNLMRAADMAMYRVKERGKNGIEIAGAAMAL